ncbi:MAG: response regulator [Deltaproteobacteria bacterium]|nr:response regulator [Deltaproteobacteria bacterium]
MKTDDPIIRILLIEDDEDDYVIIRDILSDIPKWRFQLDWVSSAHQAKEHLLSMDCDVCLLDYRLDNEDGIEVLKTLKKSECKAPIIMLTGYGDHEIDMEAMKAGAADYLEKGNLEPRVLERSIRYAMDRARALNVIQKSERGLRELSSRLVEAQERERMRLAKELHDSIGANLAAIKYMLEAKQLQMGGENEPPEGPTLEKITDLLRETIVESQRIATNLRPSILDDMGILAAIQWVVRKSQEVYSSIHIETEIKIMEEDVPESLKIIILRIIQEALNNAAKHSEADTIHLSLEKDGGFLTLLVKDNGKGFHPERLQTRNNLSGGMGLQGMRERAELYGGIFQIDTAEGKGCALKAKWPLGKSVSGSD